MEQRHHSVLFQETLDALAIEAGDIVVDATVGGAGHFAAMLEKLDASGTIVGIDADQDAIERAQKKAEGAQASVHLVRDNFRNLASILDDLGIETADKVLFDLGWSSFQLSVGRGFTFREDEPLLMTYGDAEEGKTAADIVNSATEEEIADIIYTYGEERFSRGIARAIVAARREESILTTGALVRAVEEGVPAWYKHRKTHPATKTFQALRIAVNDELGALREALAAALARVSLGGRIAVISFHSIEDRIVKSAFRDAAHEGQGMLVNKRPIAPSDRELMENPRARSAKLRVFARCDKINHLGAITNLSSLYA